MKLNLERNIKLKFRLWYSNFLSSDLNLDTDRKFVKSVNKIKQEKIANDWSNELWELNPKVMDNLPFNLEVPAYYQTGEKPLIQPFDPRFTLGVYFSWISKNFDQPIPFHWSDWVNLSKLNKFILNSREKLSCNQLFDISNLSEDILAGSETKDLGTYCIQDPESNLGFKITDFSGANTAENHEILSKSFLYSSFQSPYKIIFLTDNIGSYEVKVKDFENNDIRNSLLHNSMVESLKIKTINPIKAFRKLLKKHSPNNNKQILNDYKIDIPKSSFILNPMDWIDDNISDDPNERFFRESIKYSVAETNPPKFFKEAKLLNGIEQNWLGEHYDWRFFNGITIGMEEQLISLHRLIKNYLNFSRQHGLITWIAHGSLLSWYWNGISFPWDTDIDVQMPIVDLLKLGRDYNQTLVVENLLNNNKFSGMGKYFVDVGSSLTHRSKGNGNNNIDARFIDIDTGLYIDITGLAITDTPAPSRYDYLIEIDENKKKLVEKTIENHQLNHFIKNQQLQAYNCRNNHFNTYEELSPLLLTMVENQLSYVPSNFPIILNYEYGLNGLTDKNFRDYIYLNNFKIWVKTQVILDYLNNPQKWIDENNSTLNNPDNDNLSIGPTVLRSTSSESFQKELLKEKRVVGDLEKLMINKLGLQDHINLLQNNQIFKEYMISHKFTAFHQSQLKELMKASNNFQLFNSNKFQDLMKNQIKKTNKNHNSKFLEVGQALRSDLFMSDLFKNDWNFSKEIQKLVELTKMYQLDSNPSNEWKRYSSDKLISTPDKKKKKPEANEEEHGDESETNRIIFDEEHSDQIIINKPPKQDDKGKKEAKEEATSEKESTEEVSTEEEKPKEENQSTEEESKENTEEFTKKSEGEETVNEDSSELSEGNSLTKESKWIIDEVHPGKISNDKSTGSKLHIDKEPPEEAEEATEKEKPQEKSTGSKWIINQGVPEEVPIDKSTGNKEGSSIKSNVKDSGSKWLINQKDSKEESQWLFNEKESNEESKWLFNQKQSKKGSKWLINQKEAKKGSKWVFNHKDSKVMNKEVTEEKAPKWLINHGNSEKKSTGSKWLINQDNSEKKVGGSKWLIDEKRSIKKDSGSKWLIN